jgi:DNA-binding NarL/FixJ family response regulator
MEMNTGDNNVAPTRNPRARRESSAPVPNGSNRPGHRKEKVRIVVADDHNALRQAICRLLAAQPGLEVVGQAANGHEAVFLARELVPDLVVMDVNMPRMNGIEATRQITRDLPAIRVLAMSVDWDKTMARSMFNAGASGGVSKTGSFDAFLEAIRTVSSGGTLQVFDGSNV